MQTANPSIHEFKVAGLRGDSIDLKSFAGQKILIVNVASECGYTPQYAQLEELAESMKGKVAVIGFPCNDFGGQEPGGAEEIQQFCSLKYGISFPLTEKVHITSKPVHPVYEWLTHKSQNGVLDARVDWNFNKFLLDEEGHLLAYYPSNVEPMDEAILDRLN